MMSFVSEMMNFRSIMMKLWISNDQEHGLAGLDADSNGHISHDEFLKAVNDNPKIMEMFGQVVH